MAVFILAWRDKKNVGGRMNNGMLRVEFEAVRNMKIYTNQETRAIRYCDCVVLVHAQTVVPIIVICHGRIERDKPDLSVKAGLH
jgi:hypothetical protein